MTDYKRMYMDYMRQERIKFEDVRDHVIKVTYKGDHLSSIPIYVYFDEDGAPTVTVKCWNVTNVGSRTDVGMETCNELNEKHSWVKFYVDKDSDVIAELDAYVHEQNCGFVCDALVKTMVNLVDTAYPRLVEALWG